MTKDEIAAVLEQHAKWLRGERGGERADLRRADLMGADLRRADLMGAVLRRADLTGADLTGADLRRADLRRATGNGREIVSLHVAPWQIAYTATHLAIGCQMHEISDWRQFDDDRIARMSSVPSALDWRRQHLDWVLDDLIKHWPATPTGHETVAETAESDGEAA